jgi:hypothetical protein
MAQLRRLRVPITHWGLSTMRVLTRNRFLAAVILLVAVAAIYTQKIDRGLLLGGADGVEPSESQLPPIPQPFSLAPGELPGYTGWARPEHTLAGYFTVVGSFQNITKAGQPAVPRSCRLCHGTVLVLCASVRTCRYYGTSSPTKTIIVIICTRLVSS